MAEAIVAIENLSKSYGRARGISDLNLQIKPGEIFGFLGPNGAGKTTTIRILLDLIRPSSGRASIFGEDCQRRGIAVRQRIGYLPGEFALYDHLTGEQLLRYFASLRGGVDRSFVDHLATRLDSDLTRPLGHLSHGNKQKVALVQAFMNRPELLILDEPTTGLDPLIQREFYSLVEEVREEGRTVFLSSHNLPEVERVCDQIAIIREGVLVTVEDVAAIKEKAVRKVEIVFESPPANGELHDLPAQDVVVDGRRVECIVRGAMDPLVKALSRYQLVDLISREPSLEEVFLALYGDERHVK